MRIDLLAVLNNELQKRRAAVLVTDLVSGAQRLVTAGEIAGDPLETELQESFRSGRSRRISADGADLFLAVHLPPVKLVIVGAVHIAQTLAPMAARVGYEVLIVDPRSGFATSDRFPGVNITTEWPDDALSQGLLDRFTAVSALTHDPKIDDPALAAALSARCFYVGALGSRKTHGRRIERLQASGLTSDILEKIRAPIGLAIGAASPEEIAVAILAEIIAVQRRAGSPP
jgi:xanthine dehydrogenase accessory factor